MGCYPILGKIVSKVLGKCNGRGDDDERWREERMNYAMAYPPGPPTETHYMRPVATSVHMIPPSPPPQQPPPQGPPAPAEPQAQTPPPQPEPAPEQAAQQAPAAEQPRQPKRGKKKPPRRVRFGPEQPPPQQEPQQEQQQQEQHQQQQPEHAPAPQGQGHQRQGYFPFRYTPSPLPRWEATPKRHEYFSGEYRYSYPTPVREGIYSIATDANRLTTIFSEENPNACAIA